MFKAACTFNSTIFANYTMVSNMDTIGSQGINLGIISDFRFRAYFYLFFRIEPNM
jgi:hypothetical protein